MLPFEKINDEVFVASRPIISIGSEETRLVKACALGSPRRRARICMHRSNDDPLHEMLIAIAADSYIHPHKHLSRSESFHIVEGAVDVVIFDHEGEITDVIELGAPGSGRAYLYRLSEDRYHTLHMRSDILVMHEVTNGPFNKSSTALAGFAPPEADAGAVGAYLRQLSERVRLFERSRHE